MYWGVRSGGAILEGRRIKHAAITVEAVLATPVFIGVIMVFLSFYQFISIQQRIELAAYKAAYETGVYGMLTEKDTNELVSYIYFRERMGVILKEDEVFYKNFIKGGVDGIQYYGSDIFDDNGYVVVNLSYEFTFPFMTNVYNGIEIRQRVYVRSYTGRSVVKRSTGADEVNEEISVYICEGSEVYHTHSSCSYIKITTMPVQGEVLKTIRNASGGVYKACDVCEPVYDESENYYITQYGDRYHTKVSCSTLRRDVKVITLETAKYEGKRLCSKCAAQNDN